MKTNHADQLRKFECPTCQCGFYFKKELKSHIRLAHEPNEKGDLRVLLLIISMLYPCNFRTESEMWAV